MNIYIVGLVEESKLIKGGLLPSGGNAKLSMKWADGMAGVCAVFTNKRKARRYAGKDAEIFTMEPKP